MSVRSSSSRLNLLQRHRQGTSYPANAQTAYGLPRVDEIGKNRAVLMYRRRWSGGESSRPRAKSSTSTYPWTGSLMIFTASLKNLHITSHKSIGVMITFSGGTGTPKLLRGMQKVMTARDLFHRNTAEDIGSRGSYLTRCGHGHDLFAGVLNTDTWGVSGTTRSSPMRRRPAWD